jgi:hypothetical protein
MLRLRSIQALAFLALCSSLAIATSLTRCARAAPDDVVDLNGDTHHNPPASTTDKATPPPATPSTSGNGIDKGVKDNRDAAKQQEAEKKLQLRAGERVGDSARGAAQVLGMSLQEGTHNRVKVVEVAMNSPAFDAGVMKGDEILAFQGFRGESYRKWIDGIRRLTADTGAGLKIPVIVDRDGKQVSVRIEVAAKPVRPVPRGLAQPGSPLIPPGVGPALPATEGQPTAPVAVVNGGNNVAIENAPFGEVVGSSGASPSERAMAQIVRIGGSPSSNAGVTQNSTAGATAAPVKGGPRIGMAGFRDEPSGMVVVVDVGALPPGNYSVGISDPSVIGGAAVTAPAAANPKVQSPAPTRGNGGATVPNDVVPAPNGASQPQGSLPPASGRLIPRSILAQVVSTAEPATAPNSSGNSVDPVPPTGEAGPSAVPPTGRPNADNTQQSNVSNGPVTLNQIGTLTVDQSGTGRMQQKVESAQVRNVVGQAIVLYSQNASGQKTASADVNSGAGAAQQAATAPQVPVAGGIIQLVTDRRPQATTGPETPVAPAGGNGAVEQPASAAPPAGQNLVR